MAIEGSRFMHNIAEGGRLNAGGGALFVVYSDMDVTDCEFVGNTARSVRQPHNGLFSVNGGALGVQSCKSISLRSVVAKDNVVQGIGIDFSTHVNGGFGYIGEGSHLILSGSWFEGNLAEFGARVAGGALSLAGSKLVISANVTFRANSANRGSGGAMSCLKCALTVGTNVSFEENVAQFGGGVDVDGLAEFVAEDAPSFLRNIAANPDGVDAMGGAVIIRGFPKLASFRGATFEQNAVHVTRGTGLGGAVHVESGVARLVSCYIHENFAVMSSNVLSHDARGGAVSINPHGSVVAISSRFASNQAGGSGVQEAQFATQAIALSKQKRRASHILCAGVLVLQACDVSAASSSEDAIVNSALSWVVGEQKGSLLFVDSTFGADPGISQASLLSLADEAQAVLRGCSVNNAQVVSELPDGCKLGIVNSTVDPVFL